MDCFNVLRIEPTKDEKEIKRAYSKLLPSYHPEQDHEGFMRLRGAYEEALSYARQEDDDQKEKEPVDLWMERVEEIYRVYKTRIDVAKWQELLEDDICVAIDSANECNERLLVFLADHILLPHEVLHVLEAQFHWESKRAQLIEIFPENYIDYVIANAKYPDNFRYMLLNPDLDMDYDAFLEDYYALERLLNQSGEEGVEDIKDALQKINRYPVTHPDVTELKMRAYLVLGQEEQVDEMCRELLELEPDAKHTFQCLARCNLELNRYEEALSYYEKVLHEASDNVGALMGKAACYKELNRLEDSLEIALKAQDIVPYNGYVRNFVAALNEELLEGRKKDYEEHPEDNQVVYSYCKTLAAACHYEEAEKIFPKLSKEGLEEKDYLELCSNVYMDLIDIERANCDKAIPSLERLIELYPDKLGYYEDLGYCYGEAGRLEDAKNIYARAKEIDVTSPRIYYRLAQIYIKEKNYVDAVKVCDEGLSYDNQIPNLYHFKAEACYYLGEYGKAMELCDRAISILPYMDTFEIKAKIYNECEAYSEVEDMLKDMQYPDTMTDNLLAQLARAKRLQEKLEEARQLLDKAIARDTHEPEIFYQRGILYFTEGNSSEYSARYENTIAMADRAIEYSKEFTFEYVLLKIQALRNLNRLVEAIETLINFRKQGIASERLELLLGDLYMDGKDCDHALKSYKKAAAINPDNYAVHGRICDVYMEQKRYKEALEEVNLQLEKDPSDYYYIDRGIIYNELNDEEKAEENYRLALKENEGNCYAWANLGFLYREQGRLAISLECFEKAIEYEHPNPINYYEAARLCRRLGERKKAQEFLTKLQSKGEHRYSADLLLGDLYAQMGQPQKSVQIFERMLQMYPDDLVYVIQHYADVYKHAGDVKKMQWVWKKAGDRTARKQYMKKNGKNVHYQYYKYMAGYYLDYAQDVKKALKFYLKADSIYTDDGYICSKIGVCYEALGDVGTARLWYTKSYELDRKMLENDDKDPCGYDCVGMDYAWMGDYDKAVEHFYYAMYYGALCGNCSMGECYEVFYDIGDAMERKANTLAKKRFSEKTKADLPQFMRERREELQKYLKGEKPKGVFVPSEEILLQLLEFLSDYEAATTVEGCRKMALKYYETALRRKPDKTKYQNAVRRLKHL